MPSRTPSAASSSLGATALPFHGLATGLIATALPLSRSSSISSGVSIVQCANSACGPNAPAACRCCSGR